MKNLYWGTIALLFVSFPGFGQASMDLGFGNQGLVRTVFGNASDYAETLAHDANGNLIVAGSTEIGSNSSDVAVARYLPNGTLDASFSQDGKATFSSSTVNERITAILVLPNGKILLGGISSSLSASNLLLIRLNSNGSLDNTFNGTGIRVVDLPGSSSETIQAMVLQADGKILVAGTGSVNAQNTGFMVARMNADGSLDNSFSSDGFTIFDFASSSSQARDLILLPDGQMLVGGSAVAFSSSTGTTFNRFAVAKLQANGSLASFGTNGKLVFYETINNRDAFLRRLLAQPDGKILLGGHASRPSGFVNQFQTDLLVARMLPDGSLDPEFGSGGKVIPSFGGGQNQNDEFGAFSLLPDQSVVVSGNAFHGSPNPSVKMLRLFSDGGTDLEFGSPSLVSNLLGTNPSYGSGQVVNSGGELVLAGNSQINNRYAFTLSRWNVRCQAERSLNATVCQGQSYAFYNQSLSQTGSYSTLRIGSNCDTLVNLSLAVSPIVQATVSIQASVPSPICQGNPVSFSVGQTQFPGTNPSYRWKKNGSLVATGSSYTSAQLATNDQILVEMTSNHNCLLANPVSSNSLSYVVNALPNPSVSQVGDSLFCSIAGSQYQWYRCPGNVLIPGATSRSFQPAEAGSYAVSVQVLGCLGNSTCFPWTPTSVEMQVEASIPILYPNPARKQVWVRGLESPENQAQMISSSGQVWEVRLKAGPEVGTRTLDLKELPAGLYRVRIGTWAASLVLGPLD